jgi:NTP pyrophosphatase (non-canonical NTP hydrolase)
MEEVLSQLVLLLKRDRERSPRSSQSTFASTLQELRAEVAELEAAHQQQDDENFKEELGDVLWVVLFLMILAEESGRFTGQEVITGALAKLTRRKPWLLSGEIPSREEEARLWEQGKRTGRVNS